MGRGKKGDLGRVRVEAGVRESWCGGKGKMVVLGKAGSHRGAGEGKHREWLAWAGEEMENALETEWLEAGGELERDEAGLLWGLPCNICVKEWYVCLVHVCVYSE